MGAEKPEDAQIVMQEPTAPTLFRTVVPEKSYQDVANYASRLNQQLRSALQEQYRQAGTSAEIGARQRGIEMQEAADVASSMPTGRDPGFMGVALDKDGGVDNAATAKMTGTGGSQGSGQYSQAKEAADLRLASAREAYSKAKARIGEQDYLPETNQQFSWAKDQSSVFNPPEPEPTPKKGSSGGKEVIKTIVRTEKAPPYPVFEGSSPRSGTAISNYAKMRSDYNRYHGRDLV